MITIVGRKEGDYFQQEELLNFPCKDLKTIDRLWVQYSKGLYGFSVFVFCRSVFPKACCPSGF